MSKKNKSSIRYKSITPALSALAAPTGISGIRSSIGLEGQTGDFYNIKIEQLIPYGKQARKVFDQEAIDALAETIQKHGIRQPLTVIRSVSDPLKYEVVSGERRLRAAKQLSFTTVPCIVLQDASKANEVALIENLHRSDLHPVEIANAYQALLTSGMCESQKEISEHLSVPKSKVSEHLKIAALPEEIKGIVLEKNLKSRDLFRRLLQCEHVKGMKKILEKVNNTVEASSPNKTEVMKSASILRITLSDGEYKVQQKAINVLNMDQREVLKKTLLKIAESL
jgi:ParB family chromosome partitioning protein